MKLITAIVSNVIDIVKLYLQKHTLSVSKLDVSAGQAVCLYNCLSAEKQFLLTTLKIMQSYDG